mmetsp:Transcript_65651/g.154439  ORF Transcript_65651/g.154439 Transcript_65651/m.154439 type:complete len:298 (+) Transcript_65651:104-997(+)
MLPPDVGQKLAQHLYFHCSDHLLLWTPLVMVLWFVLGRGMAVLTPETPEGCQKLRVLSVFVFTLLWTCTISISLVLLKKLTFIQEKYSIVHGNRAIEIQKQYSIPPCVGRPVPHFVGISLRNLVLHLAVALSTCCYTKAGLLWSGGWSDVDFYPGLLQVLAEFWLLHLVDELLLDVSHRWILHAKPLYALIHKDHHSAPADEPLSFWYMTLPDSLLEVTIPVVLFVAVLGCSWLGVWILLLITEVEGLYSHSGLDFGWPFFSAEYHYLHHAQCNVSFSGGWMDVLLQTQPREAKTKA